MVCLYILPGFDLFLEITDRYLYLEYYLFPILKFSPITPVVPLEKSALQSFDLFDDVLS